MKVIERTYDIQGAQIMAGYLRANGIDARVLDAETSTLIPMLVGGVRIVVDDADEAQARRLLASLPPATGDDE